MTQNIYDRPEFFKGYSALPRSLGGLEAAPEWPALRAMLPAVTGVRVLDLGCGFGWFCRWALAQGAAVVTGVDVSQNMLARARETSDPSISYVEADLEGLTLAPSSADLIYSSLALHYLKDLDALFGQIAGALAPGGRLVFSVEHPLFTAPRVPGWQQDAEGRKRWPVDSYLEEGPRERNWFVPGVIKQHRAFATYLNLLTGAGLRLLHAEEWGPTEAQLDAHPALADECQRPTFLLLSAARD